MKSFVVSLRLVVATLLIIVVAYTAVVLGIAKVIAPEKAQGSLISNSDGRIIGSRLLAQKFTQPGYFWPRPSAVDYNAAGAGGSNKSPTSTDLTECAAKTVMEYGATPERPLPAELAAASGGGLDPHITERGALYQADRIAKTRGMTQVQVEDLINKHAFLTSAFFSSEKIVNVLELNLALDGSPRDPAGHNLPNTMPTQNAKRPSETLKNKLPNPSNILP